MSKVEDFLTASEEKKIIEAIKKAEKNTSGEIRVHIEKSTNKPPMDRALEVFYFLKMDETELRNAVLLYIAVESKKFAILGDKGIHEKVSDDFWETEKNIISAHFKVGEVTKGLELAIEEIGEKLKIYFPYQTKDINELPDEISKG